MKKQLAYLPALLLVMVLTLGLSGITVYAADMTLMAEEGAGTDISDYQIALSDTTVTYTGSEQKPTVTVTPSDSTDALTENTDYTVAYTNNTNVGTATVTVTGKGSYKGTATAAFEIKAASISNFDMALSKDSYIYTNVEKKPTPTLTKNGVTLAKNVDYTVAYSNNINAGTATITVTGMGNYTGTLSRNYTIGTKSISKFLVTLSKTQYTYSRVAKKPVPTVLNDSTKVQLVKDTDYTVAYSDNISAGTVTVTITGKGNYGGTLKTTFTIAPRDISKMSAKLSKTSYTYNGTKRTPTASITYKKAALVKGTDYKIKYTGNKSPGIATVTITGKGNFTGTITKTFKIIPATPSLLNAQNSEKNIVLSWEKDSTADGYQIYRKAKGGSWKKIKTIKKNSTTSYTDKNTGSYGSSYSYRIRSYKKAASKTLYSSYSKSLTQKVQTGQATIASVTPASKTSLVVSWNKVSDADGYILYRKVSGKWKKIKTFTNPGIVEYTDTGLKYGKKYSYLIKSYKNSGSKKITGAYDTAGFTAKLAYSSKYVKGYKLYYDAAGNLIKDVEGIIGKQSSYYLKVNKQCNTLTVYAKDGDKGYTIPVKAFVTSCGNATPTGTFYTPVKYRWHTLSHSVEGQWCTRITADILFHSVWYRSRNNKDLSVTQYNKLGSLASAGCVRVTCEAAKWIYDNCSLGTKVTIYNSSTSGPLGKPTADILPSWHTWDPTDPNCKSLCEKHGCH